MTSVKSLYLPVENLARELDGKLLLALVARERGWRPVIGHKAAIRGHRSILPPGIYLAHNARRGKAVFFERFGRYGHQSVVLDEEALVRQTDDIFLMKHEQDAFDKVSLVLTWGEDDAELWRRSQRIGPERVVVTGNPRMDVLRRDLRAFHQPEIDAIRERFGDYVLLNTNFTTYEISNWSGRPTIPAMRRQSSTRHPLISLRLCCVSATTVGRQWSRSAD